MVKILISACLLGEPVRYHGGDARVDHPALRRWREDDRLIPVCPEEAAGLGTPRPAAEIRATPDGRRVITGTGLDVTEAFHRGAAAALQAALESGARMAVLKDGSPSCASSWIYDGGFAGRRIEGRGVTADALRAAGVKVFSETDIDAADAYMTWLAGS